MLVGSVAMMGNAIHAWRRWGRMLMEYWHWGDEVESGLLRTPAASAGQALRVLAKTRKNGWFCLPAKLVFHNDLVLFDSLMEPK